LPIILLCFLGNKSSNTGIEHLYKIVSNRTCDKHGFLPEEGPRNPEQQASSLQRHCC
jgi:hypothetical protein